MYVDPHCAHAPFQMKMHKKRSGFHTLQSNCDMRRVTTDRSTTWVLFYTSVRFLPTGTDMYARNCLLKDYLRKKTFHVLPLGFTTLWAAYVDAVSSLSRVVISYATAVRCSSQTHAR